MNTAPVDKLLLVLKSELKQHHRTYREVARYLGVSEATVKRYFSGKGISVNTLQKLAEFVGLDFFSLAALAQQSEEVREGLSAEQLAALRQPGLLRMVFFHLASGWSRSQIERESDLGDDVGEAIGKLIELKLVERVSGNSLKVVVKPDIREHAYGQMREVAIEVTGQFLSNLDLRDKDCEWQFTPLRLTRASALKLNQYLENLREEMAVLRQKDIKHPPEVVRWYEVFTVVKPVKSRSYPKKAR